MCVCIYIYVVSDFKSLNNSCEAKRSEVFLKGGAEGGGFSPESECGGRFTSCCHMNVTPPLLLLCGLSHSSSLGAPGIPSCQAEGSVIKAGCGF